MTRLPDGRVLAAGDSVSTPLRIAIHDWPTLLRLSLNPDLAMGEAWMEGRLTVENGSIYDLLDLVTRNLRTADPPGISRLARWGQRLMAQHPASNDPRRSKQNVARHYDLDAGLYELFLDSDRQYSCAYFEEETATLEQAQLAKKRHLAAKLALSPGQRVLDIGCGWGGLALYLAAVGGVSVTGITLSEEQLAIAQARGAKTRGVDFRLQDYRALTERFDRVVSVGMFEHVGPGSYPAFFASLARLLDENGVAVLHYIGRSGQSFPTNPWILKYIFPGGYMPPLSEVLPVIEAEGLIVTDIEVLRLHYAETLRHWRARFLARRSEAVALYDERFARMWEFYLAASETAFRSQGLVVHQIQMVRRQDALPLTRDYMQKAEAALRQAEAG
ncbi:class I SAM-dependent methyltransferase [Falsigemmobacter faecalis]|uniref:Class I SAM-dependent methyltransferase n=2 Tax=Falsigemmobacter faecalis TaxID=2488730 RepID=A0A3P3DWZ6_9RHOB|nr:class I SAM-dependent methyltransferase [Falsigemmobacter faecalis]